MISVPVDNSLAVSGLLIILVLGTLQPHFEVTGITLAPIYWNSSNPMFKTSKNDHIIDVMPNDEIDFVCPHASTPSESSGHEYYLIYRVSQLEYTDCNVYSESLALLIVNCSNPRQKRRFTILFEQFQSIPNVPEYKAGHSYYFITTSSGKKTGLRNLYQGACHAQNMKLTIRVCCDTDGTEELESTHHKSADLFDESISDVLLPKNASSDQFLLDDDTHSDDSWFSDVEQMIPSSLAPPTLRSGRTRRTTTTTQSMPIRHHGRGHTRHNGRDHEDVEATTVSDTAELYQQGDVVVSAGSKLTRTVAILTWGCLAQLLITYTRIR